MKKQDCTTNGHTYGLWTVSDTKASRTCLSCNHQQDYPLTKEILEQVKKQHQSIPLLEGFLKIPVDDPNFIGYINVMLEDIIDYLDETSKNIFIQKLNAFITTNFVSEENKLFINNFITSIQNNDIDLFCDTKDEFDNFNGELKFIQPTHHKLG